jgi:hypothetical protein
MTQPALGVEEVTMDSSEVDPQSGKDLLTGRHAPFFVGAVR